LICPTGPTSFCSRVEFLRYPLRLERGALQADHRGRHGRNTMPVTIGNITGAFELANTAATWESLRRRLPSRPGNLPSKPISRTQQSLLDEHPGRHPTRKNKRTPGTSAKLDLGKPMVLAFAGDTCRAFHGLRYSSTSAALFEIQGAARQTRCDRFAGMPIRAKPRSRRCATGVRGMRSKSWLMRRSVQNEGIRFHPPGIASLFSVSSLDCKKRTIYIAYMKFMMPRTLNVKEPPLSMGAGKLTLPSSHRAAALARAITHRFVRDAACTEAEDVLMETAPFEMTSIRFRHSWRRCPARVPRPRNG